MNAADRYLVGHGYAGGTRHVFTSHKGSIYHVTWLSIKGVPNHKYLCRVSGERNMDLSVKVKKKDDDELASEEGAEVVDSWHWTEDLLMAVMWVGANDAFPRDLFDG